MTAPPTAETIIPVIADIFARRGADEYLGEQVSMAEHMLQSAHFAERASQSNEVIAAALLHDIGHYVGEFGTFTMQDTADRFHEDTGAEMLSPFLPPRVVACVQHHVAAKRYLCATKPEYFRRLSPASIHSLNLQGGPMSEAEAKNFAANPYLSDILKVRTYDEAGKQPGLETKTFADYMPMLQNLVDAHCGRERTA